MDRPINRESLKEIALLMTQQCVIKPLPKTLTDEEIQNFTKEVSNKLYTFLCYFFLASGEEQSDFFLSLLSEFAERLSTFERPEVDHDIIEAVERMN